MVKNFLLKHCEGQRHTENSVGIQRTVTGGGGGKCPR